MKGSKVVKFKKESESIEIQSSHDELLTLPDTDNKIEVVKWIVKISAHMSSGLIYTTSERNQALTVALKAIELLDKIESKADDETPELTAEERERRIIELLNRARERHELSKLNSTTGAKLPRK